MELSILDLRKPFRSKEGRQSGKGRRERKGRRKDGQQEWGERGEGSDGQERGLDFSPSFKNSLGAYEWPDNIYIYLYSLRKSSKEENKQ